MFSQNLSAAIQIMASSSFIAVMSSIVYLITTVLINYILARTGAPVKSAGLFLGSMALVLVLISAGSWGIFALAFVLGWTFYWGWRFRLPYQKLFTVNVAVITFFFGLSLISPFLIMDLNMEKVMSVLEQALAQNAGDLEKLGIKTATDMVMLKKQIKHNLAIAQMLYPFLILFYSVIVAVFLMPIVQFFWKRYQGAVQQKSTFFQFRLPDYFVFILLGFLGLSVWNMNWFSEPGAFVAWNGLLIVGLFYALQGGSVFIFFIQRWKKERILFPVLLIVFLFLGSYAIVLAFLLLAVLGMSDFWIDFRKNKNNGEIS